MIKLFIIAWCRWPVHIVLVMSSIHFNSDHFVFSSFWINSRRYDHQTSFTVDTFYWEDDNYSQKFLNLTLCMTLTSHLWILHLTYIVTKHEQYWCTDTLIRAWKINIPLNFKDLDLLYDLDLSLLWIASI